jgi:hypothetical protein
MFHRRKGVSIIVPTSRSASADRVTAGATYVIDTVEVGDRRWALNEFENDPSNPKKTITAGDGERFVAVRWKDGIPILSVQRPQPWRLPIVPRLLLPLTARSRRASTARGLLRIWVEQPRNGAGGSAPGRDGAEDESGVVTGFVVSRKGRPAQSAGRQGYWRFHRVYGPPSQ